MKSFSIAKVLYLPLILILCAAYSWRVVGSGPDAWAHAAIGRWILDNRQAPHSTLFLWSANQPWIAHSWLFEVFAAWLLGFGERTGAYLLLGFNVLFTALTFATVWLIWQRSRTLSSLTPFLFILAIQASNTRFQARAESFSVLFLAVLFAILTHRRGAQTSATAEQNFSRKRGFWFVGALTILMALWTNLHGVVAAGVLTLWATALLEIAQSFHATKKVGAWPLWLLAAAIISTLATLINPYGAHYWLMLRQGSDQPLIFSFVDEWKPFWQAPTLAPEIIITQVLLWLLALIAWLRTPARRWSHLAWLLVMAALFLSSRRNSWLLSVASLSVLGLYGAALAPTSLWRQWQSQRLKSDEGADESTALEASTPAKDEAFAAPPALQSAGRAGAVLALLFTIWQGAPPINAFSQPLAVPTRMADFLQARQPPGRWFNEYDQSPYLQWCFAGKPPLYIDTLSAYTDEVLLNYLHVMQATPRGQYWLDAAKVNTVVMPRLRPDEQPPKLFFFLHQNPQWRLIYLDDDGIVWTRRKPLAAK